MVHTIPCRDISLLMSKTARTGYDFTVLLHYCLKSLHQLTREMCRVLAGIATERTISYQFGRQTEKDLCSLTKHVRSKVSVK